MAHGRLVKSVAFPYNHGMNVELRPEEETNQGIVEELTGEAFWNLHVPGCDEHLLAHNLRKAKERAGRKPRNGSGKRLNISRRKQCP